MEQLRGHKSTVTVVLYRICVAGDLMKKIIHLKQITFTCLENHFNKTAGMMPAKDGQFIIIIIVLSFQTFFFI